MVGAVLVAMQSAVAQSQAPATAPAAPSATAGGDAVVAGKAIKDAVQKFIPSSLDRRMELQRSAEMAKLTAEANLRNPAKRSQDTAADPLTGNGSCSQQNYKLISVYGPVGSVNAELLLCGTAMVRRQVGQEIANGWILSQIQSSHVVITQGKKTALVWMPPPPVDTSNDKRQGADAPSLPNLPPLPGNLAPSPVRAPAGVPTPDGVAPMTANSPTTAH